MLHHDRLHFGVREQATHLATGAAHPRADLGLHPRDGRPGLRGPLRQSCGLPDKIVALVVRGDGGVQPDRELIRTAGTGSFPSRNR